jgi:hypothetical protein
MCKAGEFSSAVEIVIEVMREGERNHLPDEWKAHPPDYHVSRAAEHLRLWQAGSMGEDHPSYTIAMFPLFMLLARIGRNRLCFLFLTAASLLWQALPLGQFAMGHWAY